MPLACFLGVAGESAWCCFVGLKSLQWRIGASSSNQADTRKTSKTWTANAPYLVASSEMQGWRPSMEDATLVDFDRPGLKQRSLALFGVFDGHCGREVAAFAADKLPGIFENCLKESEKAGKKSSRACEEALKNAVMEVDRQLHVEGNRRADQGVNRFDHMGSTAIVAVMHYGTGRFVTVANLGDSRAIICRNGATFRMSEDHKPGTKSEKERIEKANGSVKIYPNGTSRVQVPNEPQEMGLSMSRALGDYLFKGGMSMLPVEKQQVIATPEVKSAELLATDEFLLLGCDGVFELNTCEAVIGTVRGELQSGNAPKKAIEELLDKCCADDRETQWPLGFDNISAIVVLLRERPWAPAR